MNQQVRDWSTQLDFREADSPYWITELEMLLSRYSELGIGADASLMTISELQGVYRFLVQHKNTKEGREQPVDAAAAQSEIVAFR